VQVNSNTTSDNPQLQSLRDCLAGEIALKAKGQTYLPRLESQTDAEYAAYVQRASFYPAASRVLDDCLSAAFRRSPEINLAAAGALQPQLETFLADSDLGGTPFLSHARSVLQEVLSVGRVGTLLQWDQTRSRPWLSLWKAEQILDHKLERIDGPLTLTRLVLQEESGSTRTFPSGSGGEQFILHTASEASGDAQRSPLADIIACNLDHYRLSADYRHGLHLAALPTAWVSGFDKTTALRIGSSEAWVTEVPGATAGFLEFRGTGLSHIERALERTETQIQTLANRLLGRTDTGEPTEAGLSIVTAAVAQSLSRILNLAHALHLSPVSQHSTLNTQHSALNCPVSQHSTLNTQLNFRFAEISSPPLRGADLSAVVDAWKAGAISRETLLECLKRGQLLPDGRTVRDEKELLYRRV
jgi:hypothetical protein